MLIGFCLLYFVARTILGHRIDLAVQLLVCNIKNSINKWMMVHPRRPRGSQSGREKRRDESFQAQAEEPLGTDSQRTISKPSSECWLLIGYKKCFVLLCPIGEQHLLSSFREFVHDGFWLDHALSGSCTKQMHAVRKLSVWYKHFISKYWLSLHKAVK